MVRELARVCYSVGGEFDDFHACCQEAFDSSLHTGMQLYQSLDLKQNVMRCLIESHILHEDNADEIFDIEIPEHFRFYWRLPTRHKDELQGPKPPPAFDVSGTANMRLCVMHYMGRKPKQCRPFIPDGTGERIYLHKCNESQLKYIIACFQFLPDKSVDLEVLESLADDGGATAMEAEEEDEEEDELAVPANLPEGLAVAQAADEFDPPPDFGLEDSEEDVWGVDGLEESSNNYSAGAANEESEDESSDDDNGDDGSDLPLNQNGVYVEDMFDGYVPEPDVLHEMV